MKLYNDRFQARRNYVMYLSLTYEWLHSAEWWRNEGDNEQSIKSFNECVKAYRMAVRYRIGGLK